MPTYAYRCQDAECAHGATFDVRRPLAAVQDSGQNSLPDPVRCPRCGTDAVRVFSPPMLSLVHRGALAALDAAERSRSEPEVVGALPPSARRPTRTSSDPRHRRLPRP